MDSFELNKVAGAALGALLLAVGSGFVAELIYHPKPAGEAGYPLPEPEPETAAVAEAPKIEPIAVRLASANVEKGQSGTKVCHACHSFEKGGPNKVGPDLWEVVDRHKGGHEGFDYSAGMKEKGGEWTYADLDHFLENPKGYVKGTKMAFAGISSPQERGNVIAYLRTLSDNPKPLPAVAKAEEVPAAEPVAAPGGEAKPVDAKPADGKPAVVVPAEAKPVDAKPVEAKPADAKPADTSAGDKPTTQNPAQNTPSTGPNSPAHPADLGSGDTTPAAERAPGSPATPASPVNRNSPPPPSTAPDTDSVAPSGDLPAGPTAPPAPATLEPPAKANPQAVDRAKSLDIDQNTVIKDGDQPR